MKYGIDKILTIELEGVPENIRRAVLAFAPLECNYIEFNPIVFDLIYFNLPEYEKLYLGDISDGDFEGTWEEWIKETSAEVDIWILKNIEVDFSRIDGIRFEV